MTNNIVKKPEILAPCGSYEILEAAVNAGADACYIGGSRFGARAFAKNLGADSILKAIDYAHSHDTKLYLTVNTLLKDNEINELYEYLLPYYTEGLDAVIVQDLGVFSAVRKLFPDISIHCSTQMNINSVHGASFMKENGASRVVTAREMPLSEIKAIKDKVDIEIETFVHGAMCYSYSGQCLMSSLAGGRSGNRGRCAQPCRKCYDGEYILSMRDMCAIEMLPDIVNAGIDSLKIEGRMKNEYYVASAVDAYKCIVDSIVNGSFDANEALKYKNKLANIYNRGGFCDGYFFRHNGPEMISKTRPNNMGVKLGKITKIMPGKVELSLDTSIYKQDVLEIKLKDNSIVELTSAVEAKRGKVILNAPKTKLMKENTPVYRTRCNYILNDVNDKLIQNKSKAFFMDVLIYARIGEVLSAEIKLTSPSSSYEYSVFTEAVVCKASKNPVKKEDVADKFGELKDTQYAIKSFNADMSDDAFFPIGEIKKLRRQIVDMANQTICMSYKRGISTALPEAKSAKGKKHANIESSVSVASFDQLEAVSQFDIDVIYMDADLFRELENKNALDMIKNYKVFINLPYIIKKDFDINRYLNDIKYDGIYIRNIDGLACYLSNREKLSLKQPVIANSLYTYNNASIQFLSDYDDFVIEAPVELKLNELSAINNKKLELCVYGYQRTMLSAQCVQKNRYMCDKSNSIVKITDDMKNKFYARSICNECCSVIYNGVPFNIMDMLSQEEIINLNPYRYKLDFSIEDRDSTYTIMNKYCYDVDKRLSAQTTGHLYRGVE